MTTTKIHINLSQGLIEVEGTETFVTKVYNDFKERLGQQGNMPLQTVGGNAGAGKKTTSAKTKKGGKKKGGPSCGERIRELEKEDFFKQERTPAEVREAIKNKGHPYETKLITATLINEFKSGRLRRLPNGKVWKYLNP